MTTDEAARNYPNAEYHHDHCRKCGLSFAGGKRDLHCAVCPPGVKAERATAPHCAACGYRLDWLPSRVIRREIAGVVVCSDCYAGVSAVCVALLEGINAEAETYMLRGSPLIGAHRRALTKRLAELRATQETGAQAHDVAPCERKDGA